MSNRYHFGETNLDNARQLKPADRLFIPAAEWGCWLRQDRETGKSRPTTFDDLYGQAYQAKLKAEVPWEIRDHFATAQNLVAYSWFYYPFATLAELAAYTSVEKALKIRFGYLWGKGPNFSTLLTRAINDGLLSEAGFPHMAGRPPVQPVDGKVVTRVELVKRLMLNARNTMAHGGPRLHPDGPFFVVVCAELINQLFGSSVSDRKGDGS